MFRLSGYKVWIAHLLINKIIEESDEHLIEPVFRKIGYVGDTLEGAKVYKKVKNAEDVEEWLDTITNV